MKRPNRIKGYFLLSLIAMAAVGISCNINKTTDGATTDVAEVEKSTSAVKWMTMAEALSAQEKKRKKIFIDTYTDWCHWCKVMDQKTFSDPDVAAYLNKEYYSVKLDAESDEKVKYKGKEMSYRQLAATFGVSAYPTTVYLDEVGDLLTTKSGYVEADDMGVILHYLATDSYKTYTYEQYLKIYDN